MGTPTRNFIVDGSENGGIIDYFFKSLGVTFIYIRAVLKNMAAREVYSSILKNLPE